MAESATDLAEKSRSTDEPVRMLIMDSVIAHFRAEYVDVEL